MKRAVARGAFSLVASIALAAACVPIEGAPLSEAPLNAGCPTTNPCEAYDVIGMKTAAKCSGRDGRCDYGVPNFPFTMVVNVPTSSFYAPGRSFRLTEADLNPPPGTARGTCIAPTCLQLPPLVRAEGQYRVTKDAAAFVGLPLENLTSIPVKVAFVPLLPGSTEELPALGVPLPDIVTSSRLIGRPTRVAYVDALSLGDFLRVAYPEPPYDQYFPPLLTPVRLTDRSVPDFFLDDFVLGSEDTPLDDDTGESRTATVTRDEGLDGFQVWLVDRVTERRISSIRTLAGKRMSVRLDTVGQTQTQPKSRSLKADVDVIVAPPESWIGVPRLRSQLINGQGLELLELPTLPGPVPVSGVVADGEGATLTSIPAKLLFTSTRLRRLDGALQPLLQYSTSVATDETGHFSTVLPPGLYDVTIEPDPTTGFSKMRDTFDTASALAKTFRPAPRTVATGRVMVADGRPLAEADILAVPSVTSIKAAVKPRPWRTRTDRDGRFRFEVDQGQYDFIVDPLAGSGFPRVVQLRSVGTTAADLGEIQVGPPARLMFTLRDPSQFGNPIVRAMVRIFAELPGRGPPAVEIGRAMTDEAGRVEILLAQQPR